MTHSGLADSPFFQNKHDPLDSESLASQPSNPQQIENTEHQPPSNRESNVEFIRSAVKNVGKEAATYRLTKREKQTLMQIIFAYRLNGLKVSENDVARIAINSMIREHQLNPLNNLLHAVIEALNR